LAIPDWIKNWSPLNGLDPFSAGRQHYEPVEAERCTTCVRHIGQGCEQILVDWVRSAENALLLLHARREPLPLFNRIAQLVESVSQLDTAAIEFEALRNAWIIGPYLSERRLAYWIGVKDSWSPYT
jgi:hypothetical protein